MTEYRLFREDTKEAFHLGDASWIKAFPYSGKHQQVPFKMETYHKTPEALAAVLKRVYGPYLEPHQTEALFLATARTIFEWCGYATLKMTHNGDGLSWKDAPWGQYTVTGAITSWQEPATKPMYCGKPDGEFGVGYESDTGPLWDHVCTKCLPQAIRKLDAQIQKWQEGDVDSYPSAVRVEVNKIATACDFDPTQIKEIATNPEE